MKFSLSCGKIFCIFEKACFRNGTYIKKNIFCHVQLQIYVDIPLWYLLLKVVSPQPFILNK